MKLKFTILVIDNNYENMNSEGGSFETITEYLKSQGFIGEVKEYSQIDFDDEFDNAERDISARLKNADLLLVDFNLADNKKGTEYIDKIRKINNYKDVILYSNTEKEILYKLIPPLKLEGLLIFERKKIEIQFEEYFTKLMNKYVDSIHESGIFLNGFIEIENQIRDKFENKLKDKDNKELFDSVKTEIINEVSKFKNPKDIRSLCIRYGTTNISKKMKFEDANKEILRKLIEFRNNIAHTNEEMTREELIEYRKKLIQLKESEDFKQKTT